MGIDVKTNGRNSTDVNLASRRAAVIAVMVPGNDLRHTGPLLRLDRLLTPNAHCRRRQLPISG